MEHALETGRRVVPLHRIYTRECGTHPERPGTPGPAELLSLYRWMTVSRAIDEAIASVIARGEAFFDLPSCGHEANAVFGLFLEDDDWLHLHYRSKALLLARGMSIDTFFHNLFCTVGSQSAGRQMPPMASDPARKVLGQTIPVGSHVLQAVGVAAEVRRREPTSRSLVLCSMGEGATQQGEALEALTEAARSQLPLLLVVEDNGFAISTRTAGKTPFAKGLGRGAADHFLGLPVHRIDGRDPVSCVEPLARIMASIRAGGPAELVVLEVERLVSHSNSDDERVYRPADELERARRYGDPIRRFGEHLLTQGIAAGELEEIAGTAKTDVAAAVERARQAEAPPATITARAEWNFPEHEALAVDGRPAQTMLEAMRSVLRNRLETDPRVTLFGEDIEDPKGDVFGVTRGLSTDYPGRVINSALAESLIVGISIGRALAGGRPVAFIQFADFLPLAYNQIHAELGSIFWRTAGGWNVPVIIMVACGGYRPGLGPFHSQTLESVFAHVPGIDVVMPSSAADAAGLLQSAFDSPRPTLFFYPKTCLNDPDRAAALDVVKQRARIGRAVRRRSGDDLTLVTWGSTVSLCERAADVLVEAGIGVDLIDLRSLSPWDNVMVRESVRQTSRLLVVHEDNITCGFGAEVVADVTEAIDGSIKVRRVARPDTYAPFDFANQLDILPSFRRILTVAAEMLDLTLDWPRDEVQAGEMLVVEAIGSSPADQTIQVVEWKVRKGDPVRPGDWLAELEADKAIYPLTASANAHVDEILTPEGQPVRPGAPLLRLRLDKPAVQRRRAIRQDLRAPAVSRKSVPARAIRPASETGIVYLTGLAASVGSRTVSNDELVRSFVNRSSEDISGRTGIHSRPWLAEGETIKDTAVAAVQDVLKSSGLEIADMSAIICSTGTPLTMTPSLACLILHQLSEGGTPAQVPAFDVSAACTGYLYALAIAHDMICVNPEARVLVITAEALSRVVDPGNFDTAIIFGDAATATIVAGAGSSGRPLARLHRPILSAKGEAGQVIRVPGAGGGHFAMNGLRVYGEAVRHMIGMLQTACTARGLTPQDLSMVVPHQANAKIMEDVRRRLAIAPERVASTVAWTGNTSSSSIPLCLADLNRRGAWPSGTIGLTAFGGGYTFGAAILETPPAVG
jgi:2-oxoisovalerate dehydrogenase E1 component